MRLRAVGPDGTVREVPVDGRVVIGRAADADLVLAGARVSRRHAVVEVRDGQVVVRDLGSANGTWRDGARLAGPSVLAAGAVVRIGGWSVTVEEGERAAAAGTPVLPAAAVRSVAAVSSEAPAVASKAAVPSEAPAVASVLPAAAVPSPQSLAPSARPAERPGGAPISRARAHGVGQWLAVLGPAIVGVAALAWAQAIPGPGAEDGGPAAAPGALAGPEAGPVRGARGLAAEGPSRPAGDLVGAGPESVRGTRGAAARLDRWRAEVAGARLLLAERRTAGDWAGAREALEQLGELDPLDPAVPVARGALALEEESAAREARAGELAGLGRDEEALALLTAIPRESWHHGRARDRALRLIRERLAPSHRAACVRRLDQGNRARALPDCRRYLDLTCHETVDAPVLAAVRRGERGRRGAPWSCPATLGAWLAAGDAGKGEGLARAVRERHPDPRIAEALLAHLRDGRTRTARESLERLAAASNGAGTGTGRVAGAGSGAEPEPAELAVRLEELDGRLVEARARLLAGDLDAAGAALERAAAIERALLPGGPPSPPLAAGRGALAAALRRRGEEHLALGREGLAFLAFGKALGVAPADPAARRGLETLDARAAARLDADPSCEAAGAALSITAPEGATHRRARDRLAAPACRAVGAF